MTFGEWKPLFPLRTENVAMTFPVAKGRKSKTALFSIENEDAEHVVKCLFFTVTLCLVCLFLLSLTFIHKQATS